MAPAETLADGYATLTLAQGSGFHYACRDAIAGMPADDSDITLEFKVRLRHNSPMNIYLSNTNDVATADWNHLFQINKIYDVVEPDAVADYNLREAAVNVAPAGFDGSALHTYRLVRDSGTSSLYVQSDGSWSLAGTLQNGIAGAAADGQVLLWGFGQDAGEAVTLDFCYLKIANGVYVPASGSGGLSWDILDECYGNAATNPEGVSFNDSYEYLFGSTAPVETLNDGYALLTLGQGSGFHYPCREAISGMPNDDSDITIEFKVRMVDNTPLHLYASETNSTGSSHWNHILQVNRIYQTTTPDAIADYNQREYAENIAPYGFGGSLVHTYRLVRQAGKSYLYVYDAGAPIYLAKVVNGSGAAGDVQNLEWGFGQDSGKAAQVEFYHLKIGHGAEPYYDSIVEMRCGDPCTVYLLSDLNEDCRVDQLDLEALSEAWLSCTDPANSQCDRYWKDVVDVGSEKQLFIDELFFASVDNVEIKVNPGSQDGRA